MYDVRTQTTYHYTRGGFWTLLKAVGVVQIVRARTARVSYPTRRVISLNISEEPSAGSGEIVPVTHLRSTVGSRQ